MQYRRTDYMNTSVNHATLKYFCLTLILTIVIILVLCLLLICWWDIYELSVVYCTQVPTACKACPCGFRFRKALANETVSDSSM